MMDTVFIDHIDFLPVGERWTIRARLQELGVNCECLEGGSLAVEITNSWVAILVSMVLFRFVTSRRQQVEWLERCWQVLTAPGG
ncbi:MAG: hypothetical protein NZL92_03885 [Gloeomargarita sp. SKYG116]|nr:hypothetical protein [Gloeomargarita sp. SKYG116]MCS7226634.1 hypothetical protein [Gloeomargarita sp. SKYB31]MDW8400822.1 hypothetical protein [Gloeomargarita sp. SKYGB_i_bin116]